MKRVFFICLMCQLCFGGFRFGEGFAQADDSSQRIVKETACLLLLTPDGPMTVGFNLIVDGQDLAAYRKQFVAHQLKVLDLNRDGKTTWKEALQQPHFLTGRYYSLYRNAQGNAQAEKSQIDYMRKKYGRNSDQILDEQELLELFNVIYGRHTFQLFSTSLSDTSKSSWMELIDKNRDNRISFQELKRLKKVFAKCDLDENEVVTREEFQSRGVSEPYGGVEWDEVKADPRNCVKLTKTVSLPQVWRSVEKFYQSDLNDIDQHWPLRREWIKPMKLSFAQKLTERKFQAFTKNPIDLELNVAFGSDAKDLQIGCKSLVEELKKSSQLETSPGRLSIQLPKATLEFNIIQSERLLKLGPDDPAHDFQAIDKVRFKRWDLDSNHILTREEAIQANLPEGQFTLLDLNQDEQVSREEFLATTETGLRPPYFYVRVDQPMEPLFHLFDQSRDGKFSRRELNAAPGILKKLDLNQDEQISWNELPNSIHITLYRGTHAHAKVTELTSDEKVVDAQPIRSEWFQRMDRNDDGDLSRREFLGSDVQFKKLDQNADGFLEYSEMQNTE